MAFNQAEVVSTERSSTLGAAMLEFAIILPLLVIVVSETIMVGLLMLQCHAVNDGVRQAARLAAQASMQQRSCSLVKDVAEAEATRFLAAYAESAPLGGIVTMWSSPVASINGGNYDSYPYQFIKVRVTSTGTMMKALGVSAPIGITASASFMLVQPCS